MKDLAAKGYPVPDWYDIQMEEEDAEEEQLLKKRASSKSLPPDVQEEEEKIDVGRRRYVSTRAWSRDECQKA